MKVLGTILALVFLIVLIFGIGYGAYEGYEFLSVQWGSLGNDWRAILIVVAAMLAACTLFLSISVQSFLKKYGLKGSGKVIAYNGFLNWYSELKNNPDQVVTPESFRQTTNQMTLWGSQRVSKQAGLLYELLQKDDIDGGFVLEKAGFLYIEIRRDLGLSGTRGDSVK